MVDLQILHLAIIGNGKFNETDIAKSELNKLGVGRILDQLASLKERNLIDMNKEGSFLITEDGRKILWGKQTPLQIKILRILNVVPQMVQNLGMLLTYPESQIQNTVEDLQKNHLIVMSTVKNDLGIVKMYEILPEGIEYLENVDKGTIQDISELNQHMEDIEILQNTIKEIKNLNTLTENIKTKIISNLSQVKKNLGG